MKGKSTCKAYFTRGVFFCIKKNSMDKNENHRNSRMHFSTTVFKLSKFTEKKKKSCFMPIIKIRNVFMFVCIPTYLFQSCYNCRL